MAEFRSAVAWGSTKAFWCIMKKVKSVCACVWVYVGNSVKGERSIEFKKGFFNTSPKITGIPQ